MPLHAYNKTTAPLALAATSSTTLPASPSVSTRSAPVNVTSELRPGLAVDPQKGISGGLTNADFDAIQDQINAGEIEIEWTGIPEFKIPTRLGIDAQATQDWVKKRSGRGLGSFEPTAMIPGGLSNPGLMDAAARGDHAHKIEAGAPLAMNWDRVGARGPDAEGTSGAFAKADHRHDTKRFREEMLGSHDPTVMKPGTLSSPGLTNQSAPQDHRHGAPTAAPGPLRIGVKAAEGTSEAFSRADHIHAIPAPRAPQPVKRAYASSGARLSPAREDHSHDVLVDTPVSTGTANAKGTSTKLALADHVHGIGDATVAPAKAAVADAVGLSALQTIRKAFTAGGGGAPDDVVIYNANAPFGFRVVDTAALISTAIASETVTLRDAAAGGGNALSDDLDAATVGRKRDPAATVTATGTVAVAGTLVLRRSDNGLAGEVIVTIRPE